MRQSYSQEKGSASPRSVSLRLRRAISGLKCTYFLGSSRENGDRLHELTQNWALDTMRFDTPTKAPRLVGTRTVPPGLVHAATTMFA